MKKNAFTLTELLATITILGILLIIAVPSYNKYIESSRNRLYESYMEQLKDAASTYVSKCTLKNSCSVPPYIYMRTLIDDGYISNIQDPKDKSKSCSSPNTANDSYVKVTSEIKDGITSYSYEVCLKCSDSVISGINNHC